MRDAPSVQQRLKRLIAATGPISIADYMASANAHYYATRDPLGADGDFTTAPEISQMFGELVGVAMADSWVRAGRPDAAYVELGPGRGTLARDALGAMAKAGFAPPVHLVETSPALMVKQAALVSHALHHSSVDTLPTDRPLLIVANEFFDALPIRQFMRTQAGWRERMVAIADEQLVAAAGTTTQDALIPVALRDAAIGSIVEQCPAGVAIMAQLAERILAQGGAMLVIDYGYSGPATGDTLQAVRRHEFADPFAETGEADLTAHVDFTALAHASAGWQVAGPVTQGEWLTRLGIDARTTLLAARHPDRATELQGQRDRLVKAVEMGQLFKVIALHPPHWPCPAGFIA